MKTTPSASSVALGVLATLVLAGCGTTTTVKLTGTPDTRVSGHYRASYCSSDFAGTAAWQLDLGSQRLEEFEFQKAAVDQSVALEIRRGRKLLVQATAEPGTRGLRVRPAEGWRVETVK